MNNKRTLVLLYKDIVLVTSVHIFYTTLFTNNNIKVVIQMHTFLMDPNLIIHIFQIIIESNPLHCNAHS
jgi:hypothetical protein